MDQHNYELQNWFEEGGSQVRLAINQRVKELRRELRGEFEELDWSKGVALSNRFVELELALDAKVNFVMQLGRDSQSQVAGLPDNLKKDSQNAAKGNSKEGAF